MGKPSNGVTTKPRHVPIGLLEAQELPSLTAGEFEAVRCVIEEGMNQTDAYKAAFPNAQEWQPQAVWAQASQLFSRRKVAVWMAAAHRAMLQGLSNRADCRAFMLELAEQAEEIPEISQELVKHGLLREARTAKQDGARVRSLELLGKAQGMFDGDGGQDSDLDNMSLADLQALSEKLTSVVNGMPTVGPVIDGDSEADD